MYKRAIILAGGKGSRLRPYTVVLPKPLMPLGDYPILEIIIRQLVYYSFTHITLAVNHQADIIKAFFGDGLRWGIKIDYSLEDIPLGTMGPLKLIDDLPDNFLVMNGDVLTDLDYGKAFDNHCKSENVFSITSYLKDQKVEFGVLKFDENRNLTEFMEKPVNQFEVSIGVNMLNKKCLDYIPDKKAFGFDELVIKLISEKEKIAVNKFSGYWLDIGRPDDYMKAIDEFDINSEKFLLVKNYATPKN